MTIQLTQTLAGARTRNPFGLMLKEGQAPSGIVERVVPLDIKKVTDEGTFEGYGSVFGVRDSYNEAVQPGAFVESLANHRKAGTWPLMLWQHNPDEPIGVWEDMAEDAKGLWVQGRLVRGVRQADEAYLLLKAGALKGMSIGYREIEAEPSDNGGPRKLVKLDLWEVSLVSFAANRRAMVTDVKANDKWARLEALARRCRDGEGAPPSEFEEVLRDAGFPKALATGIASLGWKAVRRESDGNDEADKVRAALAEMAKSLDTVQLPQLG